MDWWTTGNLLIALAIAFIVWAILTYSIHIRPLAAKLKSGEITGGQLLGQVVGDFVTYALPLLAFITSIFVYGGNSETSAAQTTIQEKQADELRNIGQQIADLRGQLHFRAFVMEDGTLVLKSLTNEPFYVRNFTLAASYLPEQPALPELSDPVPYDPTDNYVAENYTIEIPSAEGIACRNAQSQVCSERLVRILLDFEVEGERYRVSAQKKLR